MGAMAQPMTARGTYLAEVSVNERICDEHYRMVLAARGLPPSRPGQFVQLLCRPPGGQHAAREVPWPPTGVPVFTQKELTESQPLLRRPLSLAGRRDYPDGMAEIEIIYRTIGTGTHWLATVGCGAVLSVLGPLGTAFSIDPARPLAALVGGGVGLPPMLYIARALVEAGKSVTLFAGARTESLMPLRPGSDPPSADGTPGTCTAELGEIGARAALATDDGTLGFAGLVSEPFVRWLDGQDRPGRRVKVYTCGPEPMMKAVAEACGQRQVACEVSMERHMACGMGTCQSCICKIRTGAEPGWQYKLCCTDGPVFNAAEIVWD